MRRTSSARSSSLTTTTLALLLGAAAIVTQQPQRAAAFVVTQPSAVRARGLVRATAPPASSSSIDAPAAKLAGVAAAPALGERTRRILDSIQTQGDATGGAGSSIAFSTLEAMDRAWDAVKSGRATGEGQPAPTFVKNVDVPLPAAPQFDLVVCGGTLGIFMATALQRRGFRVCVVERGPLQGRAQEWNISRKELKELVAQGVLGEEDVAAAIAIDFNPIRVGFVGEDGPFEFFTRDILHLGVSPGVLLERAKQHFLAAGGVVRDNTPIEGVRIAPNGAAVDVAGAGAEAAITGRLVIDCMGNQSPISRQHRWGKRPDGICIVVGTCAAGFAPEKNTYADLMYSFTPTQWARTGDKKSQVQYFWEAFPASSGPGDRTTYMFLYCDAKPERPSILETFEDYWDLLPQYQGVASIDDLQFKRAVCNFFPTYADDSPLPTQFDRLCAIGDASGIQSPLSFGGFGSITRHLARLTDAFSAALETDSLTRADLGLINAYQPSLSVAWLFQRSMSVPVGKDPSPHFISRTLINNFKSMQALGDPVLRPFLQDVVQAKALFLAMAGIAFRDFFSVFPILTHVGPAAFFGWFRHYANLVGYTLLYGAFKGTKGSALLPPKLRYQWDRRVENWLFGSGLDYEMHE